MTGLGNSVVKMIAAYLERAVQFEQMAAEAGDDRLKKALLEQARAYRNLANERAKRVDVHKPTGATDKASA